MERRHNVKRRIYNGEGMDVGVSREKGGAEGKGLDRDRRSEVADRNVEVHK